MTTIRPITFDQLEAGMILGIEDGEPKTYFVNSVMKVEQFTEILEVELTDAKTGLKGAYDRRMWNEHQFEQRGIQLIGQRLGDNSVYFTPAEVTHDPEFEPDPAIHEAFINGVVVNGVEFTLGQKIDGFTISRIELIDDILYYYNKNDALIVESKLVNVMYSAKMGYREKEAEA